MQSLRTANNTTIAETFRHMVRREGLLRYTHIISYENLFIYL